MRTRRVAGDVVAHSKAQNVTDGNVPCGRNVLREPNPVFPIIGVRTAQVGGAAIAALLAMGAVLPPERMRPVVAAGGALVAGGLSAYFVATFTAALPLGAPVMTELPNGDAVALTFDDGPHPATTPRLLDLLAEHDAKATFFVVGESARRYPDLLRRIRDAGHGVGVHGLRHRAMVLESAAAIRRDLREAIRVIEQAAPGGLPVRLFRPPYGFKTWTLGREARRLGLQIVAWSLDGRDYDPLTAEALLARLRSRLRPGAIVLLHERPQTTRTLDALPGLLRHCAGRGWRCVALDGG